jgi:pimeloyl-ACP methyl ester carboxylesterase
MKTSTLIALSATSLLAAGSGNAAERPSSPTNPPVTAVLVHGAFADGSSWQKVIPLLQQQGLNVIAVQNPLTSLEDDVAFAKRAIDAQPGPVVLVGHSWGGSVITQAGADPKVKALVYVAAFAPSKGETSLDGVKQFPPAPGLANAQPDANGFLALTKDAVQKYFAQDVTASEKNLIFTTQGAVRVANFEQKLTAAAWQDKPSYYIVAEQDYMIQPDAQRALARKIDAKVTSLTAGHVPMLSKPNEVAAVIVDAARGK